MIGNGKKLPDGWIDATIEDLFALLDDERTLHQGWSPQCEKSPSSSENEWGVLRTTAIQSGAFCPEHNKRLPVTLTPRPLIEVHTGDILITCAGPRARCGIACLVRSTRRHLMLSGKMYRFRVSDEHIDTRYVEAYLQTSTAWDEIDRMKTGGSDSGLNLTHDRFRTLRVPVAPLNEQRRIVEEYEELTSDLDAATAALLRVKEKLKLYRASVLKAAVRGELTEGWRSQQKDVEPAAELLKRILVERRSRWEEEQLHKYKEKGQDPPNNWKVKYKEPVAPDAANLPPLPEGWCWATLAQVLSQLRSGTAETSGRDTTHYPILKSSAVRHGSIDLDDLNYLQKSQSLRPENFLRQGDFLITRLSGSLDYVGCCAIVKEVKCEAIQYPDRIFCGKLVPGADGTYLTYCFQHSHIRKNIEEAAKSTAGHQRISMSDLYPLLIPLPPFNEQEAIVEAVEDQLSVIDHLEADIEAKLKNAQALRQAILRHAFIGQLVPQDPNDEPASELLKRIIIEREARAREAVATRQSKKAKLARSKERGRGRPAGGRRKK